MATQTRVEQGDEMIPAGKTLIDYEEAMERLTEDEAFKATVYAMNTLLIQKGFYSAEEFRFQFRQSAQKAATQKKVPLAIRVICRTSAVPGNLSPRTYSASNLKHYALQSGHSYHRNQRNLRMP